jgi:hypothetical protein
MVNPISLSISLRGPSEMKIYLLKVLLDYLTLWNNTFNRVLDEALNYDQALYI